MTVFLVLMSCGVLYLVLGRALLALWGWCTGAPTGHRAMRAAAGGEGAQSTHPTARFYFNATATLLWMVILAAWPVFFAALVVGWVARKRGTSRTVHVGDFTITMGGEAEEG